MIDPPEFHTKTLSPLSPVPVHPPVPSKIPVLRNQIDPIFNMTSTHTEVPHTSAPEHPTPDPIAAASPRSEGSPSAGSSFSDAYKEQTDVVEGNKSDTVEQVVEDGDSDDYAMTFDSDGAEGSDSQVISQANVEQDTNTLPAPVPAFSTLPQNGIVADTQPVQTIAPPTHPSTAHSPALHASESTPDQGDTEADKPKNHTYEDIASGEVDIQALLDNITANAEKNEVASALSTPTSANPSSSSLPKGISNLPAHSSLPPRPQVPLPSYPFQDDASKHRPGQPNHPQPANTYRPPPGVNVPLIAPSAAPGTSTDSRGVLYAPPAATFRQPLHFPTGSPISPAGLPYPDIPRLGNQDHPAQSIEYSDPNMDADIRWGPDVQQKYDTFLSEERNYVTEGQWDRFPNGSRLFIGNLPSEKVTKRDIFHVFHKYGRLAQIAIKSAYGFVQFHDSASCRAALTHEEGAEVRGRKIHLEISKAQKNTSAARNGQSGSSRRSGSPDFHRGNMVDRGVRGGGHDRQDSRTNVRDDYGRMLRGRDDYRPGRSPSPRGTFRGNDGYGGARGDSYTGRDNWRSRSRSPYGQRDVGRYRDRSPSPRRLEAIADAELQVPRREPYNVPDVELILMSQLDRNFVSWVESELHARGLKSEVLFLSPRLPLDAIIRRQILEGVHAVSQLDMRSQSSSTIPLQVFNRQGGANNVRFDEYQDLEPRIAAELILRAKSQAAPTFQPPQPQYSSGQSYQPPPAPAAAPAPAPDLASILGQLDNASLQKLLGSMATPQQQNAPAVAANSAIDLASLLSGLKAQQPQQPQQPQYQPPPISDPYANTNLASLLGNGATQTAQPAHQQSAQQVQNIMAQLAKFRQ